MTVLEDFAARLLATPDNPDAVAAKLTLHFTDTIGAMVAGAASREGYEIAAPTGDPALFADSLADRIARCVAQTRLTEVDDIHMASCTTVGSVVVPVALGVARASGAEGARIAAGLRAGYDAMVRLGLAIDGARILYKGIWPTYFCAPFAAAATASAVLGLDASRTAHALALALVQISGAAGGPAPERNPRWLLAGWAAAAGVRAALAARDGFGGDRTLLDSDWLQKTHGVAFDASRLQGAPGSALLEMSIKPWCTAKQACAALSGFIQLLDEGVRVEDIAQVRVHAPSAYRAMIAHQPPGRIGRIVSIAWQCALAACYRGELYDIERMDHASDPRFAALLQKVEVVAAPDLDAIFPQNYPARVEIGLANGDVRTAQIFNAPGDPGHELDENGANAKFLNVVAPLIGEEKALKIRSLCGQALQDRAISDLLCSAVNL